ncbi:2Fe-2S iron-sulfur cluster-binding protein [Catalinimonas sp. 4WD22]|uniref:2Fe-2S iron-sulfur cluster-binding protein n=1 Tax=Catalinimonas locisalis TaxID=3133978 RepID=UPI0031011CF4
MDIKIHIEEAEGKFNTIEAPTDMALSLMEILKASDYPVAATCGGMALCASCHIEVLDNTYNEEANDAEMDMLDTLPVVSDSSRLACQMPITEEMDGIRIRLMAEEVPE